MMNRLIEQYVNRMNKCDVLEFANKVGIELNDNEIDLIYTYAKKDWKTIVYGNPRGILDELKKKLNINTYNKLENLYFHFREKYKNYL